MSRFLRTALNIGFLLAIATRADATEYLVSGYKLVLKDTGTSQKLVYLSRDPAIQTPTPGGADDPTAAGATLTIGAVNSGLQFAQFDLPSSNWILKQTPTGPLFKFRNPDAPGGPSEVKHALLRAGFLKVKAASTGVVVAGNLSGVGVQLDAGSSAWCSGFGINFVKNQPGLFVAKENGPPLGCVASEMTTTTTSTTTTSCPPPTALYCGVSGCAPLPALCPSGLTCQTVEEGCGCVGASIPCGDASLSGLSGNFCRWGTCPAGLTCGAVAKTDACGFDCACH